MKKFIIIFSVLLLLVSLSGCERVKQIFGKGEIELDPATQAEEHYNQLKPLVENAGQCLDYLYELDEQLGDGTVALDYALQRTNELKQNYAMQRDTLKTVKVPADFQTEWKMTQQWFDEGYRLFDLMADTIYKEKAGGGPPFEKSMDVFYAAQDREFQFYENMTAAYDAKMESYGFTMEDTPGGGDFPKAIPKGGK